MLLLVPKKILQKRFINKGISPVQQVLVKWSDWPEDLATWEGLLDHQQRFPNAPAWGQASSQDRGDVMLAPLRLGLGPGQTTSESLGRNGFTCLQALEWAVPVYGVAIYTERESEDGYHVTTINLASKQASCPPYPLRSSPIRSVLLL